VCHRRVGAYGCVGCDKGHINIAEIAGTVDIFLLLLSWTGGRVEVSKAGIRVARANWRRYSLSSLPPGVPGVEQAGRTWSCTGGSKARS